MNNYVFQLQAQGYTLVVGFSANTLSEAEMKAGAWLIVHNATLIEEVHEV